MSMTTLQPKTPFFLCSLCFWFFLRCHVYCCWCSFLFFIFIFLQNWDCLSTTCWRKCVKRPSWEHWKPNISEAIKWWTSFTTYRKTDCPPPQPSFTPSQWEQNNFMFAYAREAHLIICWPKGEGRKTKSEELARYVTQLFVPLTSVITVESWKCLQISSIKLLQFQRYLLLKGSNSSKRNML